MVPTRFQLGTALALSAAMALREALKYLDVGGTTNTVLWPVPPTIAILALARSPLIGAKVGLLGVLLNVLAMTANEGSMPVVYETDRCAVETCEESWLSPGSHVPATNGRFSLLADRFAVPYSGGNAILSAGDIVLGAGLLCMAMATVWWQRRDSPQRRGS